MQLGVDASLIPAPIRILLVEDEAVIRYVLAEALRELGVTVIEATTADEAWEFLTTGGSVDLVFTDHRVPGILSGAKLAATIRRHYPDLTVIVTSAFLDDPEWTEPIVRKPYSILKTAADLAEQARKGWSKGNNP